MKGIGRTVFNGSRIDEFQVEILGVLDNAGPRQSIILARLSGGPLAETGVLQGMSGSPVYIDGKLVGAVAMAFAFAKEPIAGIRPIEDMLQAGGTYGARPQRLHARAKVAARSHRRDSPAGATGDRWRTHGGDRHAGILFGLHPGHSRLLCRQAARHRPRSAAGHQRRRLSHRACQDACHARARRHDQRAVTRPGT